MKIRKSRRKTKQSKYGKEPRRSKVVNQTAVVYVNPISFQTAKKTVHECKYKIKLVSRLANLSNDIFHSNTALNTTMTK